jgi:hypothetical protein
VHTKMTIHFFFFKTLAYNYNKIINIHRQGSQKNNFA